MQADQTDHLFDQRDDLSDLQPGRRTVTCRRACILMSLPKQSSAPGLVEGSEGISQQGLLQL